MTIEIPLTQGKVALIDDNDLALVSGYKWRAQRIERPNIVKWYAVTTVSLTEGTVPALLMHRLLTGAIHGQIADHRDGDGLNNQRQNLRVCTTQQNNINRISQSRVSQFKGIRLTASGKWQASIGTQPNRRFLGTFATEIEAAQAHDRAAEELHGEYAHLNFPAQK